MLELVIDERALSSLSEMLLQCLKLGGFVSGAERFDRRLFGISVAEVGAMDPQQQQLLLERRVLHQRRSGRARPSCSLAASDARREPCAALSGVGAWARGS